MLKTLQILKYFKDNNWDLSAAVNEIMWIVDNGTSDHFYITELDHTAISKVFENERLFNSALEVAGFYWEGEKQ